MRTVWYNGNILIGDQKFCEAIVVEDNKIVELGASLQLLKKTYDKKIDLKKKTVIPGLHDSHLHFLMWAKSLNQIDIRNISSVDELIKLIKRHLVSQKVESKQPIFTAGLDTKKISLITRQQLDDISLSNPIFVVSVDQHTAFVNTAGLKFMNAFSKNFKSMVGGEIVLDQDGWPNGVVREQAQLLFRNKLAANINENIKAIKIGMQEANKLGITSVSTCDLLDELTPQIYEAFNRLNSTNKLTVRFNHQCWISNQSNFEKFLSYKLNNQNDFNRIESIKLFMDGSFGSRTAAISKPYLDNKDNHGYLNYKPKEFLDLCKYINSNGYSIVTHAIGDDAIQHVLDAYEHLPTTNKKIRNGIVHAQITTPKLIKKLQTTNTYLLIQPVFFEDDQKMVQKILPAELSKYSYLMNSLIDNKVHVSFGTDAPISSINPWENIYFAISRKISKQSKHFKSDENVNIFDAINAYTLTSAYISGQEKIKGKIAPNYLADFIVLNQNIFNLKDWKDILKTKILTTVVNGKIVYSSNKK